MVTRLHILYKRNQSTVAKHLKLLNIQYDSTIISLTQNVGQYQKSEECCIPRLSNLIIKHKVGKN